MTVVTVMIITLVIIIVRRRKIADFLSLPVVNKWSDERVTK